MTTAELLTVNSQLIQRNRDARASLAAAYNLQEVTMSARITRSVEPRSDGWVARVFVDGYAVAKKQVKTLTEAYEWIDSKTEELRQEVR